MSNLRFPCADPGRRTPLAPSASPRSSSHRAHAPDSRTTDPRSAGWLPRPGDRAVTPSGSSGSKPRADVPSAPSGKDALGEGTIGFGSSGTSPTGDRPPLKVHLLGAGKVGQQVLRLLAAAPVHSVSGQPVRLVACTDSSGTVYGALGMDPAAILAAKVGGLPIAEQPGGQRLATATAIQVVGADVVLDTTPSDPDPEAVAAAVALGDTAFQIGAHYAVAGKQALAAAGHRWVTDRWPLHCNAALGGTGRSLLAERKGLAADWTVLELVGNATSSRILDALAAGGSFEDALSACRADGLLESDPTCDLDGTDPAVKLAATLGLLTGTPVPVAAVQRIDLRCIDPDRIRDLATGGRVPRLVAVAERVAGADACFGARLELRSLPLGHPLAVPPDRVAYRYTLAGGHRRVHVGAGIGPAATADALLADVIAITEAQAAQGGVR